MTNEEKMIRAEITRLSNVVISRKRAMTETSIEIEAARLELSIRDTEEKIEYLTRKLPM